jgi:hypothetical protein
MFRPGITATALAPVALPVRLLTRLTPALIAAAVVAVDLEEAIRWEVAALLEGRTVGELGLLLVLQNEV